ncbi:MAG: polymerase sigma-70 factor family protein [Rickettsiales bacterium]|jgi:RNA polymerase sigma-70 factor (ECF subfamily)|nr:polymerase sigma-70 factor family protein [Rickettsiales bacterium]
MATELPLPTDDQLLSSIQDGSHSAFATLVNRHTGKFYSLAYRYTSHREEAEDIVQTAFLKLWERPDMWDRERKILFTTWFYKVVVNICLDRKKRATPLPIPDDMPLADSRRNQEEESLVREEQRLLEEAMTSLPKRQKTALNLCFYEGLSQKDVAQIMGTSVKAVQSLVTHAKSALKQHITARSL